MLLISYILYTFYALAPLYLQIFHYYNVLKIFICIYWKKINFLEFLRFFCNFYNFFWNFLVKWINLGKSNSVMLYSVCDTWHPCHVAMWWHVVSRCHVAKRGVTLSFMCSKFCSNRACRTQHYLLQPCQARVAHHPPTRMNLVSECVLKAFWPFD